MSTPAVRVGSALLRLLAVGVLAALTPAAAQEAASSGVEVPAGELWALRARYGLAIRTGSERASGSELSYDGLTPSDFGISAWAWPLLRRHLGLAAAFQREGFGLYDGKTLVTSGGLIRASVGPGGRVVLGPVSLDGVVSYTFQQLPVFGTAASPSFGTVTRHALLLAARAQLDLGPVTLEGRFEYPIALAVTGAAVSSTGLAAGGAVRVRLVQAGALDVGVLADGSWSRDTTSELAGQSAPATTQRVVRASLGLDLRWKEPKSDLPPPGRLLLKVTVEGVAASQPVTLELASGPREVTTPASGVLELRELSPGPVTARAVRTGLLDASAQGELPSGGELTLTLALVKPAPTHGALKVLVVSRQSGMPLPGAQVSLGGRAQASSAVGLAEFAELPPGPVPVKVSLPEFTDADEAVAIVAGQTTELTVRLVPVKKRVPATLSGLVRNARGGAPVAARLELRELKQSSEADAKGAFSLQVPGGKYTVRIAADGFIAQTKTVTVRDGDQAIFNVDLFPK